MTTNYQLYRNTTLGITLQDALDSQISAQQITPDLALKVLQQFDRSISTALSQKVKTRYNFKGRLKVYRYCDNVWTTVIEDVRFNDTHSQEVIQCKEVKIVACEAPGSGKSS